MRILNSIVKENMWYKTFGRFLLVTFVISVASHQPFRIITYDTSFRTLHPDANLIPLHKKLYGEGRIVYTLGGWTQGDVKLFTYGHTMRASTYVDVEGTFEYPYISPYVTIQYPLQPISHIEIIVVQDSNLGEAYLVNGGIGAKWAVIYLEAVQVQYVSANASFYTRPSVVIHHVERQPLMPMQLGPHMNQMPMQLGPHMNQMPMPLGPHMNQMPMQLGSHMNQMPMQLGPHMNQMPMQLGPNMNSMPMQLMPNMNPMHLG